LATAAGPSIARKIIEAAKNGDPNAQRLFCQHLLPKPKFVAAATPIDLVKPNAAQDAAQGVAALLPLVASGALDLDGAGALTTILRAYIEAHAAIELESKVAALQATVERLMALVEQQGAKP
jgi:hypothetical protein